MIFVVVVGGILALHRTEKKVDDIVVGVLFCSRKMSHLFATAMVMAFKVH